MLSAFVGNAQTKNQKTEEVKIYGNCGMCESTIEKAGNMKKKAIVDWDKDTKMATITYDSLKTSKEEILKRIALAGYDSDTFLAPIDTYNSLPGCCQYERANIGTANTTEHIMADHKMEAPKLNAHKMEEHKMEAPNMDIKKMDHSDLANQMTKKQGEDPLAVVFNNYFAVKDALVSTNAITASEKATDLLTSIDAVKMEGLEMDVHMAWMKILPNLKEDAKQIAGSNKVKKQREHFITLSKNMYEVIKLSNLEQETYYQFCPMANDGKGANWLSKEETIKNPYYGSQMLSCGKTVETIKSSN